MTRIRLATYNIHAGIGRDGRFDFERIASVINELQADVVALHEVESQPGDLGMLGLLAGQTGLRAVAGPTLIRASGHYGNALLTRCRFLDVVRLDLSVPAREPRGALDVQLECRGLALRVLATHLGLRPAERRQQVRMLLRHLDPAPTGSTVLTGPTVLMGDLNEWFLWGWPLRRLHRFFEESPAPATFPSRFPLFALDRFWLTPRHGLCTVFAHRSALARIASDHLPLVAEIDL